MPELKLAHRLSDDEIRQIFLNLRDRMQIGERTPVEVFLMHLAKAVECAKRADFLILRGVLLLMIGKYDLGRYLESPSAADQTTRRSA